MQRDAVAIVLAGGRSRRFGPVPGGKAAADFAGETLLARVCGTLAAELSRVTVVAAPGQVLPALPPGVEVVRDRTPGAGPLAGIADGLRHVLASASPEPRVAVFASCDIPLVRAGVVRMLLGEVRRPGVRWAVPRVLGHPQVLLSAGSVGLIHDIEAAVAAGVSSPRAVLAAVAAADPRGVFMLDEERLRGVDPGLESFLDIDTPGDLVRLASRANPASPGR